MKSTNTDYPMSHLSCQSMNRVIRHRLRNLCAGMTMAVDRIRGQTADTHPQIADRCAIMNAELNSLELFTDRIGLLFDSLPSAESQTLFELLSLSRNFFERKFPLCNLTLEGEKNDIQLAHGSWLQIILRELLTNAAEAAGPEGEVRLFWTVERAPEFHLLNDGETFPAEIPVAPPVPFTTLKGRHDGLGLAIVNRICLAMNSELTIDLDKKGSVRMSVRTSNEEKIDG